MGTAHPAIDQVAGKKLKFAVLVTGNSAPEIEQEFGDYGVLYKALLADPDLDEEWQVFYPVNDHFPTDDDLKDFKVGSKQYALAHQQRHTSIIFIVAYFPRRQSF